MIGRVALTLPPDSELSDLVVHVGHARTILLGQLICDVRGIDYRIRFDGPAPLAADSVMDVHRCMTHLGIHVPTYHPTIPPPMDDLYDDQRYVLMSRGPSYYRAQVSDDAVHGNLIIRGREFLQPERYFDPVNGHNVADHVEYERRIHGLCGRDKNEVNVPIITLGDEKLSKTRMRVIHWSVLASLPTDVVRSFLISTAMHPEDPIGHLGCTFDETTMSTEPYDWDWNHWNALVRHATP